MHETKGSVRSVESNQATHLTDLLSPALLPSSAITHFRTTSLQFHADKKHQRYAEDNITAFNCMQR